MKGKAAFTHGRTGERIPAEVRTISLGLEIRDRRDGLMLALWGYGELLPAGGTSAGRRGVGLALTCRSDPTAHLAIDNTAMSERLRARLWPPPAPRRRASRFAVVVAGLAVMAACLFWRQLTSILPPPWAGVVGRGLADGAARYGGGACDGGDGQAAADALARRLGEAGNPPLAVSIRVVRGPTVEPLVFAGGQVVLFSGLLREARSADEAAAAVAGALAHPALGRGAGAETHADNATMQWLERADISAQAMGNFFRRQRPGAALLSDHPGGSGGLLPPAIQPFARPALTDRQWQALRGTCD